MMLRPNLRTDAQICGKSANQASLFVRHGRVVNRVYCDNVQHILNAYGNSFRLATFIADSRIDCGQND